MQTSKAAHDPVFIFEYLYKVRIPNLQSMSPDYIKHFGMPTSGDAGIDAALANQLITTMLPISKMVDYHREGVAVYVVRQVDVKEIYDHISRHLHAWREQLEHGLNIGSAPIDDLIAMDEFANSVYDHAKYQFTRDTVDSLLLRQMSSTVRLNRDNFFKTKPPTETNVDGRGISRIHAAEDDLPARESLTDIFRDRKIGRKLWK